MKWIKDVLSNAKELALAPLSNLLCGFGLIFLVAAFFDFQYDKVQGFVLHRGFSWLMLVVGVLLVANGIGMFVLGQKEGRLRIGLNYKRGITIKRGELTIIIKELEIQNLSDTTNTSAIALPTNNTFVDDCATDPRTALGAFFLKHFPAEASSIPNSLKAALDSAKMKPNEEGQYFTGTTIILPDKFAKPAKVLVTASTMKSSTGEISSNPHIICNCVEEIFRITSREQIDTIFMPILGSGHGGVDRGLALLFLLFAILHFSKTFHHLKNLNIVVHPKDIHSLNQSKELRAVIAL